LPPGPEIKKNRNGNFHTNFRSGNFHTNFVQIGWYGRPSGCQGQNGRFRCLSWL